MFVKHELLVFTVLQAFKKVLISVQLWSMERKEALWHSNVWVHNLMSSTCLFCILAFAYMHLKHNFKQVLHDDHSWNKNPKHQASYLERVTMFGKAPLS